MLDSLTKSVTPFKREMSPRNQFNVSLLVCSSGRASYERNQQVVTRRIARSAMKAVRSRSFSDLVVALVSLREIDVLNAPLLWTR